LARLLSPWETGIFKAKLLIELIRQYGAVIEVGIGVGWFSGLSYLAYKAAIMLVGK
jgi:hypothetical protein